MHIANSRLSFLTCLAVTAAGQVSAQTPVQIQKLYDPTGDPEGYSTSIAVNNNESQLLIGAQAALSLAGTVFAYYRNAQGVFAGPQQLTAADASPCAFFGLAVAISDTTAVVGAPSWPGGCPSQNIGKVYVFTYANGTWTQTADLLASDGSVNDRFGASVAIDGTTIVVGTPHISDPGAVYVFDRNASGIWIQTQKLSASISTNQNRFGQSVAISGNNLAAGMAHLYSGGPGSVNFFSRSGGVWTSTQTFQGIADGSDGYGFSVSMRPTTTAVGAYAADVGAHAQQGAVSILRYVNNAWSVTQTLTVNGGSAGDRFGYSVALGSGGSQYAGTLIAGANAANLNGLQFQGAAYIFFDTGTTFSSGPRLTASDFGADNYFGGVVGLATGFSAQQPITPTYFVGAVGATGNRGGHGAVYVFH
jgi:hypothetical protein